MNKTLNFVQKFNTVKAMILSIYRPVTVALPLQRYRDSPSTTVSDRYGPCTAVTERY